MGNADEKAVIPGMPTILPADLTPDQTEAYIGNSKKLIMEIVLSIICLSKRIVSLIEKNEHRLGQPFLNINHAMLFIYMYLFVINTVNYL